MTKPEHAAAFAALRTMLRRFEPFLVPVHDSPDHYYLDTAHVMKNGKPLFFGAARIGRQYVSCHLMPIYVFPELLDGVSPALAKRMQGKSCFNFKAPEPQLFDELADLIERGFARYRVEGYLTG